MIWPFENLKPGAYGLIVADPPWSFSHFSAKGQKKSAQKHYSCMSGDMIEALPVSALAAADCALALWATAPMLPHAISTMKAWRFEYKSAATWAKKAKGGEAWAFGTGYIFRSASEFLLIGTRGKPTIGNRSTRNLIVAPVREHSRKPDVAYEMLADLFPCDRRCELFSRETRAGWDVWGNEAGKFDRGAA